MDPNDRWITCFSIAGGYKGRIDFGEMVITAMKPWQWCQKEKLGHVHQYASQKSNPNNVLFFDQFRYKARYLYPERILRIESSRVAVIPMTLQAFRSIHCANPKGEMQQEIFYKDYIFFILLELLWLTDFSWQSTSHFLKDKRCFKMLISGLVYLD